MSGRVRAASRDDADAIARLWRELIRMHAAIDPIQGLRPGGSEALGAEVRRALGDADVGLWVAEDGDGVAGFCLAHLELAPPLAYERNRVLIDELIVEASARRRGIGRALVAAALDWARARSALRVEVRVVARNAEGQAFWRALGFGDFVDVLDLRL